MTSSAQQDETAVAAVRGGDAERYRELVERHERRVYAVAWSRLGDAALAEEVTQEAFIRAYQRLWLLGDGAKFSGWVATIARRVAINLGLRHRRELNKRERWALESANESAGENSVAEPDPLHTPQTLRQTLAELPDSHRECLVLFYLEGKSGAEAAAALGISEAALRVRLHRARAAMRERLEEKLEGSLANLRPTKTLVSAIMAGVLASSSAKAATAGGISAGILGTLAKYAPVKLLSGLTSFAFLLPMFFFSWLSLRRELANFSDQQGFRARLFRDNSRRRMLWFMLIFAGILLLMHLLNLSNWKTLYLILAAICLLRLTFQIKRLSINRSQDHIAEIINSIGWFLISLLVGLGWMLFGLVLLVITSFMTVMIFCQTEPPRRMDNNLFLRGVEGLLTADESDIAKTCSHTKRDLLAFARFLGSRWLASNHRWTEAGLELRLPPINVSLSGILRNLSRRSPDSRLLLQPDGKVEARLGEGDRKIIQDLHGDNRPSNSYLENVISRAVEFAWRNFHAGNIPAAECAIGQMPESDIFIMPRVQLAQLISPRVRSGIIIGFVLLVVGMLFLTKSFTGSSPSFSLQDALQDISKQNYKRAMDELSKAKTEDDWFYALGAAAKESFVAGKIDEARNYAQELLSLMPKYEDNLNYGKAVQDANLVLGRIAVREGNVEAAKKYLITAGESPGSPVMDSFGPNMTLAKDLLEKGERDTVLEYLILCRKFWKMDYGKLDQWISEVRAGKTPDFGANIFF